MGGIISPKSPITYLQVIARKICTSGCPKISVPTTKCIDSSVRGTIRSEDAGDIAILVAYANMSIVDLPDAPVSNLNSTISKSNAVDGVGGRCSIIQVTIWVVISSLSLVNCTSVSIDHRGHGSVSRNTEV